MVRRAAMLLDALGRSVYCMAAVERARVTTMVDGYTLDGWARWVGIDDFIGCLRNLFSVGHCSCDCLVPPRRAAGGGAP